MKDKMPAWHNDTGVSHQPKIFIHSNAGFCHESGIFLSMVVYINQVNTVILQPFQQPLQQLERTEGVENYISQF